MKKKLFFVTGVAILTVAVSAFFYVNKEQNASNTLFNANVEALANEESTTGQAKCYINYKVMDNERCLVCVTCSYKNGRGTTKSGVCKY